MLQNTTILNSKLEEFCRTNRIVKLIIFGSALRDDFREESNIDIVVQFEHCHTPGYITFSRLQRELGDLFENDIDLHTYQSISKYFRETVKEQAEIIYEKASIESNKL